MNNTELNELIANVEVAVTSTLKNDTILLDDLASRLGMIHFRMSLLPEGKDTQALLDRTVTLAEKYYEKAVELRVLCQDMRKHMRKLIKDNQTKTGE